MSKHTPGPWRLGKRGRHRVSIDGIGWYRFAKVVVKMTGSEGDNEEGLANARLIAAAPELLEVAKALRQHLALFCGPDDAVAAGVFRIADAAIAKAEGGQP